MNITRQVSALLRGRQIKNIFLITLWLLLSSGNIALAEDKAFGTFTFENDLFAQSDDGYTNGLAYAWGYTGFNEFNSSNTPNWIRSLSEDLYISTMPSKNRAITYQIAQGMVTPEDIETSARLLNDVPYTGSLTWKVTQYAIDKEVTDTLSLLLGVVGPISLAEKMQKAAHSLTSGDDPKGWDNQLENEPVFRLSVGRKWRLLNGGITDSTGYDVISTAEAGIGNISSMVDIGLTVRFGKKLLQTYPAVSILPGREVNPLSGTTIGSYYFFVTALGRYTANNIVIDGNTFKDNAHNITLEHGQSIYSAGLSVSFGDWSLLYAYANASKLVKEAIDDRSEFGSLSISWKLD